MFWTLILFMGFYAAAGLWASVSHRRTAGGLWIMAFYVLVGGFQAVAAGTVTGLMYVKMHFLCVIFFVVFVCPETVNLLTHITDSQSRIKPDCLRCLRGYRYAVLLSLFSSMSALLTQWRAL